MSQQQIATAHLEGLHAHTGSIGAEPLGTFEFYDSTGTTIGAGYISPNLTKMRANHTFDVKKVKSQRGQTNGIFANDEMIECAFDFVAEGTSRANAMKSARLPEMLTKVKITNMPIIPAGAFTDAYNSDGTPNSFPWIYEGGGTINGESEDVWTGTITLRRYRGIPTWAVVT